jgi:hypothetical protein
MSQIFILIGPSSWMLVSIRMLFRELVCLTPSWCMRNVVPGRRRGAREKSGGSWGAHAQGLTPQGSFIQRGWYSSKSCLKYFFRLDHRVDLIFYSSYFGKLACLIPSWCTFGPHKLFGFPNNKIDFVSWHSQSKTRQLLHVSVLSFIQLRTSEIACNIEVFGLNWFALESATRWSRSLI